MDEIVRKHVWISGRVQGVFFRDECRKVAQENKLTGWVKNLNDGRVEAVFEGASSAVERAVAWCKEGPPRAHVDRVEEQLEPVQDELVFRAF